MLRVVLFLLLIVSLIPAKEIRVVSLYSAYTEILVGIGCKDKIVGTTYRDAKKMGITSVGNHMTPSIEAVISCNPTFVLGLDSGNKYDKMRVYLDKLGISYLFTSPKTVESVKSLIVNLGKTLGADTEASQRVNEINKYLDSAKTVISKLSKSKKTVFVEVRQSPAILSIGDSSIVADVLKKANCIPLTYGKSSVNIVDIERILADNPDFYIQQIGVMNRSPLPLNSVNILSNIEAIKSEHFGTIQEKLISRPGLNIGKAVYVLAKMVYGDEDKNE